MDDPSSRPADPRGSAHTTPRWVNISAVVALILVVAVGVMLLAGGGDHGPGRHTSSGDGGRAPQSTGTETESTSGHTPPAGGHTP